MTEEGLFLSSRKTLDFSTFNFFQFGVLDTIGAGLELLGAKKIAKIDTSRSVRY